MAQENEGGFSPAVKEKVDAFVERWENAGGSERANCQLFLTELCALLDLPKPDPAGSDTAENAYVFERRVSIDSPDGSSSYGFIDLYKKDCFVLEAKQTGIDLESQSWDRAMLRAHGQADKYVRALPIEEGRPPFIVVTDVGRSLALYSEFSGTGGTYVPFPDPSSFRIRVSDIRDEEIQRRLHLLWHHPKKLDPSKYAARVTREISAKLAELARQLEEDGYEVQRVAHFLKRCLFTMFSEDVGLLPVGSFTDLLVRQKENPEHFADALRVLWESMNEGGYSPVINEKVKRFNGGLFRDIDPIPLEADQIQLLIEAAKADWRFVEPAIFGTLLERALDPRERHKLGAHYTPREYVERLVIPTVIEPLREEWQGVQVETETWLQKGSQKKALEVVTRFHLRLCSTRILDPACGSANFLYVALEHIKRLEGEVLNVISDLTAGQATFDTGGLTVDPHQFIGLEINPRAAAIAEMVLWIGYLQWHHRIHGDLNVPEPILRDFKNIENRDALIDFESREAELDEDGEVITVWDRIAYKPSRTTGELVPDETSTVPLYTYTNPTPAVWPKADFVVGNPPFIGNKRMRSALGRGYVQALRTAHSGVSESADFVMYWWHIAANQLKANDLQRFGFITTNSVRQVFNRKVTQPFLDDSKSPVSLVFAIPDHPWVDSTAGAAVRIAMTVAARGNGAGLVRTVTKEEAIGEEQKALSFSDSYGLVHADLSIGANILRAVSLLANSGLSFRGMIPHGKDFLVPTEFRNRLDDGALLRPYRNNSDITENPRNAFVIDTYGLSEHELKTEFPESWQWLFERVKPNRDHNSRKSRRENWWLFGENQPKLRGCIDSLRRYMVTGQTSKHRTFTFLSGQIVPDDKLIAIGIEDAAILAVLSSRVHVVWAQAAGGALGKGNHPVYNKTSCFEAFPFPILTPELTTQIRDLGELLESTRWAQINKHKKLTLTKVYNVMEQCLSGQKLSSKEREIHESGLVSLLLDHHNSLDRLVLDAYGWGDLAPELVGKPGATTWFTEKSESQIQAENELLKRLVELNAIRVSEEAKGSVRWLRPEFQAPSGVQGSVDIEETDSLPSPIKAAKQKWPKSIPEQVIAIRSLLERGPYSLAELAEQFNRRPIKGVGQVLSAMEALGHVQESDESWSLI